MATTTLVPNSDGTTAWTSTGSTNWSAIDEGTGTPNDADYVKTENFNDADIYAFTNPEDNMGIATSLGVVIRINIDQVAETAVIKVEYSLDAGASWTVYGYVTPTAYSTKETVTMDVVSGLVLGRKSIRDLKIRVTFLEVEP